MAKPKKIPKFKSEAEEAEYWANHDSTEYIDYSKAQRATFPKLKQEGPTHGSAPTIGKK